MIFSKKILHKKTPHISTGRFQKNVLVGEIPTSQYLVVVLCELNHAIIISRNVARFVPNFQKIQNMKK